MTRDVWQNITNNVKDNNVEVTEINLLLVGSSFAGKTTLLKRIYGGGGGASAASSSSGNKKSERQSKNNNNNENQNDNEDDRDGDEDTAVNNKEDAKKKKSNANKVKPTTALDYSFVRRNDRNASAVSHFWELAQGNELAQLSDIVMTPDSIHALVLAVVVDVGPEAWVYNQGFYLQNPDSQNNNNNNKSNPSTSVGAVHPAVEAWDTAVYWLRRADARVHEIFEKMKAKGSRTPEKLLARALKLIGGGGGGHPDAKKMRLSGVPTVLIVNKMDLFHDSTVKAKVLAKCFRYLAHLFGAHLIFTSENETLKFKMLMHHVLFQSPLDARCINEDCEKDAVLLTADKDTFVDIGEPAGGGAHANSHSGGGSSYSSGDPELDRWRGYLEGYFPPPTEEEKQALLNANNNNNNNTATNANNNAAVVNKAFLPLLYVQGEGGYGEATIDALRRQKDEELEQYRRANKGKKEKKEVKA